MRYKTVKVTSRSSPESAVTPKHMPKYLIDGTIKAPSTGTRRSWAGATFVAQADGTLGPNLPDARGRSHGHRRPFRWPPCGRSSAALVTEHRAGKPTSIPWLDTMRPRSTASGFWQVSLVGNTDATGRYVLGQNPIAFSFSTTSGGASSRAILIGARSLQEGCS